MDFLVCVESRAKNHVGEEWDDFLFVKDVPDVDVMNDYLNIITDRSRKWYNKKDAKVINIVFDGPKAYESIITSVKHTLSEQKISVEVKEYVKNEE